MHNERFSVTEVSSHVRVTCMVVPTMASKLSKFKGIPVCPKCNLDCKSVTWCFCFRLLYNIIPGASNSKQLICFFDYALDCQRYNGLPLFNDGNTVVMDNCGFHHGYLKIKE